MIKWIVSILLMGCTLKALASQEPVGFLWYNTPKPQVAQKKEAPKGIPFHRLSYTQRDKVLHFYTMEALHRARQTQSMDDMRQFLALQDYWMKESSRFRNLFHKTMLYYPEYDYSVTHPTSHMGTKLLDAQRENMNRKAIQTLSKTHGLLFFYRAKNSYDQKQIAILRDFSERFALPLIPVSVDGARAPEFPESRLNKGQAEALGVRFFPAVLLVNPQTQTTLPIAFGFTTQDVLERNLVSVIHHFKEEEL
jgi:conjugal transfer pilus assembly protein TraF